jgi:hypothetical protein
MLTLESRAACMSRAAVASVVFPLDCDGCARRAPSELPEPRQWVRPAPYPRLVNPGVNNEVDAELKRVEEAATYSAQAQFSSSKFWRGLNLALGVPAAALAAVAGATGLADAADARTAAVIALIAAALTAVMTTLNAAQRAEQSHGAANAYLALQGDARILRTIDLPSLEHGEARQRLSELVERRNAINETAPVPAFLAYWFGKRNIEKGRQKYEVDKG